MVAPLQGLLVELIRRQILTERLAPDTLLPDRDVLSKCYEVPSDVVASVLEELAKEAFLVRSPLGYRVRPLPVGANVLVRERDALAAKLRERIMGGEFLPNQELPPRTGLALHYCVTTNTVLRAMYLLQAAGLAEEFRPPARAEQAQQVVEKMRRAIRRGRLEPGARLPRRSHLARVFHVSVSVIELAVQALAEIGYVEVVEGLGTYVRAQEHWCLVGPVDRVPPEPSTLSPWFRATPPKLTALSPAQEVTILGVLP